MDYRIIGYVNSMLTFSKDILDEIINRLIGALHPEAIYLFGSHVRGSADRDSDVDLLVVVDDSLESPRELARTGRRSLWGIGIPIDLIVCTSAEMDKWSKVHCNLIHTVTQEGQKVYAAAG